MKQLRRPTEQEMATLHALFTPKFPGSEVLLEQAQNSLVRELDENGSLEFHLAHPRALNEVKYAVPVEAEYEDQDGVTVHILVHMQNCLLHMLDIWKDDGSTVITRSSPNALRILVTEGD